jgi:hypothetical protein
MVELSDAAAKDIEQILDRSVVDFGPHQTELYTHLGTIINGWVSWILPNFGFCPHIRYA